MMSIGILILGTFSEYGQSDCEENVQEFLECFIIQALSPNIDQIYCTVIHKEEEPYIYI